MNYLKEAQVTKSDKFYPEKVSFEFFCDTMAAAIAALQDLDRIKKALFYGKDFDTSIDEGLTCVELPVECLSETEDTSKGIDVLHGIIGKATEAGELLEALQLAFFGEDGFDVVNIGEEIGDGQWYDAIICGALGFSFEEIQTRNIAKLRARFPDKFTEFDANNRDLFEERAILEGKEHGMTGGVHDAVLREIAKPFVVDGDQVFINEAMISEATISTKKESD